MLYKSPKQLVSPFKIFVLSECAFIIGSILLFQHMRTSKSARHFAYKNFPYMLQIYYNLEEKIYHKSNQESDLILWQQRQNEY